MGGGGEGEGFNLIAIFCVLPQKILKKNHSDQGVVTIGIKTPNPIIETTSMIKIARQTKTFPK